MSSSNLQPKTEIYYIFAFIGNDGSVTPHFTFERYATVGEAKQNAKKVIDMLPPPVREQHSTYLCEVVKTYKIIESV
jgi:hypothetical protein